jgi:hypothetical protein
MCGVGLAFDRVQGHAAFTMDHIWPRCYGGNSNDENLLPACNSCNSGKKRDLSTWAMTNPHALILGFNPGTGEYDSVEGHHRYALHVLAAQRLASKLNINLKAALARLGPWGAVRVTDEAQLGDFFNLANHSETVRLD